MKLPFLRRTAAALALTFAAAAGAALNPVAPEANNDPDAFDIEVSDTYLVAACTPDRSHTMYSKMTVFESIPDWDRLDGDSPETWAAFQSEFDNTTSKLLQDAWAKIIGTGSFNAKSVDPIDIELVGATNNAMLQTAKQIEAATGISVKIGLHGNGFAALPGCTLP